METTITFESLPKAVAELTRKIDLLSDQLQKHDTEPDRLLSLTELQEYLEKKTGKRYAAQTIYMWVNDRTVPFVKHGKYLYFRKSEIDQWLANGRQV